MSEEQYVLTAEQTQEICRKFARTKNTEGGLNLLVEMASRATVLKMADKVFVKIPGYFEQTNELVKVWRPDKFVPLVLEK